MVSHSVVDAYTLEGTEQLFCLRRNHYLWIPRPCKICLSFLLYNLLLVDSCQAGPSPNTSHTALDTLESNDSSTHSCPSLDLPKGRNCVCSSVNSKEKHAAQNRRGHQKMCGDISEDDNSFQSFLSKVTILAPKFILWGRYTPINIIVNVIVILQNNCHIYWVSASASHFRMSTIIFLLSLKTIKYLERWTFFEYFLWRCVMRVSLRDKRGTQ